MTQPEQANNMAKRIQKAYKKRKIHTWNNKSKLLLKAIYNSGDNKCIITIVSNGPTSLKLSFMDLKTKRTVYTENVECRNGWYDIKTTWENAMKDSKGSMEDDCKLFSEFLNKQQESVAVHLNIIKTDLKQEIVPKNNIIEKQESNTPNKVNKQPQTKVSKIKYSEENAAKRIQAFFSLYYCKLKATKLQNKKIADKKKQTQLLFKKCLLVCNRYVIVHISNTQTPDIFKLMIYDPQIVCSQEFLVDYCHSLSIREVNENALKILDRVKYNKDEKIYFMDDEKEINSKEFKRRTIVRLSSQNIVFKELIKDSIPKKKIYHSVKDLGRKMTCELSIWLNIKGRIEIETLFDGEKRALTLKHNFAKYFLNNAENNLNEKVGLLIVDLIKLNEHGNITINEADLRLKMVVNSADYIRMYLQKIQARFRICLTKLELKDLSKLKKKKVKLFMQFAVRLGKQIHLIKVFNASTGHLVIKSNRANNELVINYEKILLKESLFEDCDCYTQKAYFRHHLPKVIAYNPVKMQLVYYKRKTRSIASSFKEEKS